MNCEGEYGYLFVVFCLYQFAYPIVTHQVLHSARFGAATASDVATGIAFVCIQALIRVIFLVLIAGEKLTKEQEERTRAVLQMLA